MKTRTRWTRLLALLPIAALTAMVGCGGDGAVNSTNTQAQTADNTPGVIRASEAELAQAVSMPENAIEPGGAVIEGALPPDISVSVADSLVLPGEAVEITVLGTPDVTEMVLWDGLNDRQALTKSTDSNAWHVTYRVPLRPSAERLGLSVTAKNDAERWRRRWVFLQVGNGTESPEAKPEPDAAKGEAGDSSGR